MGVVGMSIPRFGRRAQKLAAFIKEEARPWLDEHRGHVCSVPHCTVINPLDVDHIKGKGAHPELKYDLNNLQYLCRLHHIEKTNGQIYS